MSSRLEEYKAYRRAKETKSSSVTGTERLVSSKVKRWSMADKRSTSESKVVEPTKTKIPTPKVNARNLGKSSTMSQVTAGVSKVTGREIRTTLTDDDRLAKLKDELARQEASGDMGGTTLLKKEIDRLNTQKKYSTVTYGNSWSDQTKAKYAQTDLSQAESKAWDDYLNVPTAANRKKAEQLSTVLAQFQERNQEALKAGTDKSAKDLTVGDLLQSFVGYLPQLEDQIGASAMGALIGAGAGSAVPIVGTAAGAKAGITAANAAHSYSLMRGSAFKELLDLGVDEEVAKKAACDEAFISALIEMGDTIMDVSGIGLGVGSLISVAEKGMAKAFAKKGAGEAAESAAKNLLKLLAKYGLNVAQEALEEGSQQAVSIANRDRTLAGKTGGTAELAGKSIKTFGAAVTGENPEARAEILQAAGEGAKIAAVSGLGGTILQKGTGAVVESIADDGKVKTQTPAEVARQAVQMPKSEAVESMSSETRKAIEKAQNASYNGSVKSENVTVMNKGATLYAQLGMKQKKAEAKAAVVQKVVEGKTITTEELKALNLTDPKARSVFTQLTGYVFPENTKVLEDRATQMAHMKRVPAVMAENARVQNQVAAAQAEQASTVAEENVVEVDSRVEANTGATAAQVGQESVSPEQVSEDIAETKDGAQAAQSVVEVAEARDPGDGPADFEHYAQAYREQVNPNASDAEVRAEYVEYMADQRVVTLPNGISLNRSGLKGLIYQNTGKVPDDQTLTAMMNQLVREQENRQRPDVKQNNMTESAAQPKSAEDVDGDLRSTLSDSARKAIEEAEHKLGVRIFVERKVAGPAGKKVRGSTNSKLREIHIAVDAGGDLSHGDVILQVLRHELTHYLQSTSPKAYEDFKSFVIENMDDYQTWYDAKAKAYKGVISAEDKTRIEDELAAEYAEKLFTDEEFIDMIARTDRSLAEKILDAIREVVKRLTGEELTEAQETALKAQKLWEKALEKTAVQVKNDGLVVNKKGDPVALHHNEGTTQFSLRTYDEQGRAYLTEWLKKAVKKKKITQTEADDILLQMEDIYELCQQFREDYAPFGAWSDAKIVVDEDGKPVFSVVKSNGDYIMNLDFSLVCKKRRTLDAVFNELVRTGAINDFNIGQEEIVKINDIIHTYGFETACAMCFVDARRFRQGEVADTFVTMYNDLVKSMIPDGSKAQAGYFNFGQNESLTDVEDGIDTLSDEHLDFTTLRKTMEENGEATVPHKIAKHLLNNPGDRKLVDRGDFMSTAGFNAVKKQNPALLSLYNSKKGSGGPKAAFGDVQYLSDILKRTGWTPAKAFAVGGVRVQSFSDYMPRMVFDYVQMIGDLAAKKLPAQAYTKEELFVKQFGLTGMKINMSLIPKIVDGGIAPGLDADGNYVWADESFDYDTAMEIQNAEGYSRNCGTICVGVSDEHIRTLMADDNIRMVIPYHKSGLNPVVAKMNHIEEFDDYTNFQNTRHASTGAKLDKNVAGDKKLLKEEPGFNELMRKLKDPRAAAEQYVRWCEDNDLLPKFDQFAYRQIDGEYVINNDGKRVVDENYYKLLEDFSVYDNGEYAPQTAVKAVFPKEGDAFGSMKDLVKQGLAEDAIAEGKRDAEVPRIVQEIRETLDGETKNTALEDGAEIRYALAEEQYESAEVSSELLSLVGRVAQGDSKPNEKVYLGTVSAENAARIAELTGIQVDGFRLGIEARQIEHILKGHGPEGETDQTMALAQDIAKMGYVLRDPDSIIDAGRTQAYTHIVNGRNRTAPTVLYEKLVGRDSYYVVQAVPNTKAKTLFVVTAFKGVPGYQGKKKEAAQLINAEGPDVTPNSGSVVASNKSVPEEKAVVNAGEVVTADGEHYSFEPGNPDQSEFVKMFDEMYGEGAAEQLFKSAEQMQRAAERAKAREKAVAESIQAAKSLAETEAKDKAARWIREHKNEILKRQREKYQEKVGQLRKEKADAVRTAVANTKATEREKAEKALTGQEINLKKHAAKRLRVKDNLYAAEKQENRERTKLRRNAAKRALSDSKAVAKKRAEIEKANGMVDTIRKNPRERTNVEKRQAAAEALRTLGRTAYRNFVNQAHDIDRFAKRQRDGVLASTLVNILGGANSTTEAIYKTGLVDKAGNRIGDSMKDTFLVWNGRKVDEAKQALLQDYMLHVHNIDRMSFVAKAREALESFEAEQPWLAEMDSKEFAQLVALTDNETEKLGKQKARDLAQQYANVLNDFREAQDKPIFADSNGEAVTADTSREIVAKYEAENPWLKEKAESIYSWWDAFMKAWAVGDSISQEEYDRMRLVYPHYVPTYRKDSKGPGGANHVGAGAATVSKATQKAKGSTREVENIEDSFANIAGKIIRLARTNELYMNIVDTAMLDDEGRFADMAVFDWDWQSGAYDNALQQGAWLNGETNAEIEQAVNAGLEKAKDGYKLTGWHDGRKYSAYISEELYKSIANTTGAIANDFEKGLLKIGNALTGPMKTAITGVNPFFAVRNLSRDIPSAIINSTSGVKFPKYMAQASAEIAKNTANWQAYQALGGTSAGYYNNEKGFIKGMSQGKSPKDTVLDTLGAVNNVTEAVTRFAEYLATIDRLGDTYEARLQGIKNAAEVTVDFSRKGRYGKFINAWVPYWNPAVQGIDKTIRSVIDSPDGSAVWKQATRTLTRAALTTVLLEGILRAVLEKTDRDDEWEELSDRDKDTYYCIPLKDSHTFLKIPKNREWGAILGTPFMRILQGIDGRENPFENYIETSLEPNFLPGAILRPREGGGFTSDIIGVSQALDLAFNEDFAGRTIVPYALEQGSLTQQYNDDTSAFSKKLGELINFSPMQIDYIIGDYFGDFGDIFVKATAESTWSGDSTPQDFVASAWETFTGSFFTDNRYSNQTNSDYYDMLDNLGRVVQDKKNQMGNEAYKQTTEYKTQKAIEELYGDRITELNKDARELPDGPDKDTVKSEISSLTKQALDFYEKSMAGDINKPLLTATYAAQPSVASNELIRLNSFAEDYAFEPTTYKPSKYTDPEDKKREYVLDDEAKDQYRVIYDRLYGEIMSEVMNTQKYRKSNDRDKVAMLEEARDDVTEETKDEFLDWLAKNRRSTEKR